MLQIGTLQQYRSLLPEYTNLVDAVFLAEKCRTGTMVDRFPGVFLPENLKNLYVAMVDGVVAGTLAVKDMIVRRGQDHVRVRMVGLVAVKKENRGQGIGRQLLRAVTTDLQVQAGLCVLWTTVPAFYAAAGWVGSDEGVVGEWHRTGACEQLLDARPVVDCVARIEQIRQTSLSETTVRRPVDYVTVPPAVDAVWCLMAGDACGEQAYALVGERGDTGVVYEIVGNAGCFGQLWHRVRRRFSAVCVNDSDGSASHRWWLRNSNVEWRRQNLGMWLGLDREQMSCWPPPQIPFFDRI